MARDRLHQAVSHALIKEGWTITHDPLRLVFADVAFLIDLGAEQLMGLERGQERIAVEVKGFTQGSQVNEYHAILGQYRNYQAALQLRDPGRTLYLAIPLKLFQTFFQNEIIQYTLKYNQVYLIVYDPNNEVVIEWHNPPQ
jgi:hypothetical protein